MSDAAVINQSEIIEEVVEEAKVANTPEQESEDASLKEILLYSFGNIENAGANNFFGILKQILIIGMSVNPLLIGMVLAIKSLWDSITDPIMAHITDNTRSKWGRRKPYILIGGILRIAMLFFIIWFFPAKDTAKTNEELNNLKKEKEIVQKAEKTETAKTEVKKAPVKKAKPSMLQKIKTGWAEFKKPENAGKRKVVLYLLVVLLLFTTFTTMNSVPYYAFGIEMCKSYDGRTRLVTWRAVTDKVAGLVSPWIPAFCFSLWFFNVFEGLKWVALITAAVGIPSTILMCIYVKDRQHVEIEKKERMGLFKSMYTLIKNPHFLKVFSLYACFGMILGIFSNLGFYLNVYWVKKSAVGGAVLGGWIQMEAWLLAFISLPLLNWACRRYQKHIVLRAAIVWMAIGTALKWWCINPDYPYLQLVLPWFFSIGIASTYTVLSTMLADITDVDELRTGQRREGMFGATNAFLLKMIGSLTPILAGLVLVLSGFDADLGFEQKASTIYIMRVLYSFIPAVMLLFSLLLLWKYPITREYLATIKQEIKDRKNK